MLDASHNNIARLAQIKTGEGKSVIIAMFAAIKALNGHKVDIVTTSPLLAKRDAENKQPFYRMLNLTVGENSGTSSTKPCYKNDIVYGDVNEFQFDILRDEYSLLGTRCGRPFDIAIVDEVDSMLIDDNSKICRLSGKIPAIEELKVLLTLIGQELNRVYERFVRINGTLYCATVPFQLDNNGKIILFKPKPVDPNAMTTDVGIDDDLMETDSNTNSSTVNNSNEQQFVEVENDDTDIDNDDLIEINNAYEFVENHLKNYVENKLLKPDENSQCLLHIPKHLNAFVKQQLSKWIWNAWQAKFIYRENIDYLITNGSDGVQSVVPIDYRNTGIIQINTAWPDGLHQFLQIKHKLRITAESLTTNFLSNVGFFSRFHKNLFGFTGTLGSKDSQELVRYIYDVDFLIVPPYKYTQFRAFNDKLTQNEQEWLDECTKSIYDEAKIHQRAVLVISETKSDATKIYDKLITKEIDMKNKIKLYTRSDNEEQNAINNELDCGQIIVATNLAGRGTDIGTTRAVEENGGLHVIVTFLPLNTRVEYQAFGRTARQGKRGTAQLFIRASSDETSKDKDMAKLKEDRDEQERQNILRAKTIELNRIEMKDRLFGKYCDLRQKLRNKENDRYKLDCVEELWGFWMKNVFAEEDEPGHRDEIFYEEKFEEFRKKIENDYDLNDLFENPFYLILKANEYIFERKKYDEAIDFLKTAIEIDTLFTVNARYNLAYALILKDNTNKTQAKQELSKALQIIEETLIPQQETMLVSFRISNTTGDDVDHAKQTTNDNNTKSDLEEQVMNRINLLYLFKSQIEQAQQIIEDAESKDHKMTVQFKKLDDFFSDTNKPTLDIKEFRDGGLVGFFQLTRIEPTPWLSIIAVGLLGIAQAVAGAALIAFTCGAAATIGTMLLTEGIGDMITAIRSAISGEFSWKEYAIQKVISLAITISTCGMAALKETGQAIKTSFQSGMNLITGKTASVVGRQVVGQVTKEGWKLVGKQIMISFAKQGVKEILKTVLDKTVLAQLSNKINEEFTKHIQEKIADEVNTNQMIRDLLTVGASLNRQTCQNEIEVLTSKMLHPQNNEFVHIAMSIAKGILNQLTKGISANLIQVFTAGKCLLELGTFLDRFLDEFRRNLNKLRETLRIDHLLHTTNPTKIDNKTAKEITEHLQREKYIESDGTRIVKQIDPSVFVLEKHKKHETHVIQVCNDIYTETTKRSDYAFQKAMITKSLTEQLANYMTSRLNSELINPVVHRGVDGILNNLSHKLEVACVGTNETLEKKLERRRAQNFIRQQGKIMIKNAAEQQPKCIKIENSTIDPAVEHLARNTETDSPGTLMDIMALSVKLGRPVVIFRNGQYDMTIGDSQAGEPLKVDYLENKAGSIGHYSDNDTQNTTVITGPMNCLYDRISEQTNIPSNELRQMAANSIRENADHYIKMLPAAYMLAEYDNKSLLYIGGSNKKNHCTEKNVIQRKNKNGVEEITEEHHNKDLSQPENNNVLSVMKKFIDSFDIDQIDVAKEKGTLYGYDRSIQFTARPPFGNEHRKKFLNSLDKKEKNIVVASKGEKRSRSHGTLRLDCQGLVDGGAMNLQIQYGRDNTGRSGSYANVILPSGYKIGKERLKALFLDSLRNQKTIKVIK
ncbi:unnamed protein product [Rotaria sp. Silwood1]|nr:unnamed protein product [Rotaria sp. Silwood1]CAF3793592.1 unnamed protein product [Rotaria sp. Silwood1]CAF4588415.1 unnamed protein product [Rotaria sp. Silwood1]CAF4669170.1 unnamed protein product [Rotaria sp. Silwood1]CAF4871306.1 unnamed protein product [Rotaria sp. Silwood1]